MMPRRPGTLWNHFWVAKGAQMGRQGVTVYKRRLRNRNKTDPPAEWQHAYLSVWCFADIPSAKRFAGSLRKLSTQSPFIGL
jgi:hypothetical protein